MGAAADTFHARSPTHRPAARPADRLTIPKLLRMCAPPRRFVATAGDRLAALEQAWQRGGAGGRGRADADCAALQRQVSGACCVIHGCTVLAIRGGAAPEACSRLLASASLMVGSGRRALVAALVARCARPPRIPAAPADPMLPACLAGGPCLAWPS